MANNTSRIAELCKKMDVRPIELAKMCGVGKSTVSAWLAGRNQPKGESLKVMAKRFGVPIAYLLGYESEFEPDVNNIDFLISCEITNLTDVQKERVRQYIKFIKYQTMGDDFMMVDTTDSASATENSEN